VCVGHKEKVYIGCPLRCPAYSCFSGRPLCLCPAEARFVFVQRSPASSPPSGIPLRCQRVFSVFGPGAKSLLVQMLAGFLADVLSWLTWQALCPAFPDPETFHARRMTGMCFGCWRAVVADERHRRARARLCDGWGPGWRWAQLAFMSPIEAAFLISERGASAYARVLAHAYRREAVRMWSLRVRSHCYAWAAGGYFLHDVL
jgi:hypothetical protein